MPYAARNSNSETQSHFTTPGAEKAFDFNAMMVFRGRTAASQKTARWLDSCQRGKNEKA